jgi:hypothetical protein
VYTTFKNALGKALPKSLLAASSSASSKFQPIIYIIISKGPPTDLISQLVFQLESETGK